MTAETKDRYMKIIAALKLSLPVLQEMYDGEKAAYDETSLPFKATNRGRAVEDMLETFEEGLENLESAIECFCATLENL